MSESTIYEDIALRTDGDIYLGVVGPVRTGKSTFIKRFMETLVIPRIDNVYRKERARDELPQSGSGRTIMTAEPKFIPEEAVTIRLGEDTDLSVRLIDCVGYMVKGASGQFEDGVERMVTTPWFDKEISLTEAAEQGTYKVIAEHSTIGLVAGLVLLYVTRIGWIDSALAMLFGGIIAWTGISILRKTASDLMDTADERYLEKMLETVSRHPRPDWIDIHNLKIIRYGSYAYIDCDLTLPWYYTVRQGHKACEELKRVIEQSFSDRVLFSVHSDPCEERHCNHCSVEECPYRREAFAGPLVYTLRELTENDEQRSE